VRQRGNGASWGLRDEAKDQLVADAQVAAGPAVLDAGVLITRLGR
jgi:hypothetical protein